jgi:hypothetical protein
MGRDTFTEPTPHLRFVQIGGRNTLQQLWVDPAELGDASYAEALDCQGQWRDVPFAGAMKTKDEPCKLRAMLMEVAEEYRHDGLHSRADTIEQLLGDSNCSAE